MEKLNNLLWDQTWKCLRLNGLGTRDFLNGQTSADLKNIESGVIFRTCWLTPNAKLKALLEVKLDNEGANIIILGGDFDDLKNEFEMRLFPADLVSIEAEKEIRRIQNISIDDVASLKDILWLDLDQDLPAVLRKINKANSFELESWRLKQGLPLGNSEINGDRNPFELGLTNLISISKGCFLGQETISKILKLGKVKQKLVYWESEHLVYAGEKLCNFEDEINAFRNVGIVTSVLPLNENKSIGLAILRREFVSKKELFLGESRKILNIYKPRSFVEIGEVN